MARRRANWRWSARARAFPAALAWGVLSPRELAVAVTEARVRHRGDPLWTAALRRFGAQLKAREAALAAPPAALPDQGDPALLAPWLAGETGLPFLDAAMRALAATGWLSAPARALVAGAALHLLRLPPAEVADALARRFTDHDPALLAQGMAAALAGRVPDPVAQGRRLDPEGAFLRRWLPELGAVPEAHLHAPWRWPPARARLAGRYPEPVIDPGHAAREARARLRRSRPAPQPRAVARPAPAGQLPLDL